jgi:hypothetical protein
MKRDSAGGTRSVSARDQFGDAIDMATDQVSAEFVAKPKRSFKVERRAAPPAFRSRHAQGFGRGVDRKGRPIPRAAAFDHGQADAGTRNRGADIDAVGVVIAGDA